MVKLSLPFALSVRFPSSLRRPYLCALPSCGNSPPTDACTTFPCSGQVLVALGLGLAQQLTGTEAILYYTPRILNQCVDPEERAAVGISQEEVENCVSVDVVFLVSLGVGVSKLIGEFVAAAVSASLWLACHLYT